MSYHTLVYNLSAAAAGATNSDMTAVTDTEISVRNSHYIFTEQYKLLALALVGASVTRGRFQIPKWNAIGEFTVFNANRALQPPSNPQWDDYRTYPPALSVNEEIQVQASNNLGAATEQENAILQIGTDDWNMNLEHGEFFMQVRASFTVTPVLNGWSGLQAITLSQSLRGGVYGVCGCVVQGTNSVAWRIIFPRNKLYHGRRMRPGGLIQTAIGDVVSNNAIPWVLGFGMLGYFHTFELPGIEVFGTLASSTTYQVFLWLVRIGEDASLLNRYVS